MNLGRLARFLLLSADELVVGIFLLLILPSLGINVPLAVTAFLLAFLVFKDVLIAPYVLKGGLEKRPEIGPEALVGQEARVMKDLSPEGLVKVNGELWSAECVNGSAERGEVVKIVGVRGSKVLVERRAS